MVDIMIPCPTCKGKKKVEVVKVDYYSVDDEGHETEIDCVACRASPVYISQFWCKCGHKNGITYFANEEHDYCKKRCWACNDCGRIVKVG